MNQNEYELFKEFAYKLKYEIMTLDDYEIIFNRLGGNGVIKSKKENEWLLYTMCHNLNALDGSPKLYFYTETRALYCYTKCSCSFDLYELVKKRFALQNKSKTIFYCVKWVCEQLNIPFNFKSDIQKSNTDKYNWQNRLNKYINKNIEKDELKIYDKDILKYFENCYPISWVNDNIDIDVMKQYNIKYYPYHDSVIIPCLDKDGNLVGIRERFLNPNLSIKYLPLKMLDGKSYEFPVNQTLYGLNYNSDNIRHYKIAILGESEKFTQQCATYFGCKNCSVSLYGKSMSKEKLKQLLELNIDEVVIALDFDYSEIEDSDGNFTTEFEAFKKNVYRIGNYFKPYCKVSALVSYGGHNKNDSPTDKGKEWYLDLFNNRENLY